MFQDAQFSLAALDIHWRAEAGAMLVACGLAGLSAREVALCGSRRTHAIGRDDAARYVLDAHDAPFDKSS
jgi:hypothetical protein